MMATGIILAGGASRRMPADKAFMEVGGRRVIGIQLEVIEGLFEEVLIVANVGRLERLREFESAAAGVCVVEEPIAGKGPLGGILSGLMLSEADENFVLACDMPFIKREAVAFVLAGLRDYDACLPATPNLRVTGFLERVRVNYVPWERLLQFDSTGRLLTNINEPGDMRRVSTDER
jgi:molybdopterin-guanine dinucleotide biosynthesis protein A